MTKICWEDPGEPLEIGISSCSSTRNADSIVNKNWIDRNSTALPELGNKISVVVEPQMGHNNQSIGTSQLPWLSRSLLLLPFDPFFAMFVLSLSSILRILEIYTAMREWRLKMTQRWSFGKRAMRNSTVGPTHLCAPACKNFGAVYPVVLFLCYMMMSTST